MFYLLIIPILIYSVFIIYKLRMLKKHDKVLFNLCEIRRDIMRLLREKGFELKKNEYNAIRRIYDILDTTIHNYNDYKSSIFNFRYFYKRMKYFNFSTNEIERIELPDNQEIKKIYADFNYALLMAFYTFTPLFKSELVIRLLIYFLKMLSRIGKKYLSSRIELFLEVFKNIERQKHNYSLAN